MEPALSDDEVEAKLGDLPGWEAIGWTSTEQITKAYGVPDLRTAMEFANAVAGLASDAQSRVTFYISHKTVALRLGAKGTVTSGDLALAARVDDEARRFHAVAGRLPRW